MIKFHFYHTNDCHSHFDHWANLVHLLNQERKKHREKEEPFLVMDIGDHMDRFNPLTEGTMGKGNVTLLNEAGYDFITIGNNEGVTLTKQALATAYEERLFHVVLANLYDLEGNRPDWCQPYFIHSVNGVKIGLTALTAPFTPFYSRLGWDIRDPFAELQGVIDTLRQEADIVILMSHVGLPFDQKVAEEITGIDIILGSHTHHLLQEGLEINSTLIAQTGKFGKYLGHVTVTIDEESHGITEKKAEVIPLDGPRDKATDRLLNSLVQESDIHLQEVVTTLDHGMTTNWFNDSELPELLAEALKEWCKGDIGMINAGVILEDLPAGVVTKSDLHRICPHPINPCKVPLTGRDMISVIEIGLKEEFQSYELKGFGFRGKALGKLVFSGLSYRINADHGISDIMINGEPIDRDKRYDVATTDMFTFGRLLPQIKAAEKKNYYLPEMLRDLLAWKLKQIGTR